MTLEDRLKAEIAAHGPLTVDQYMTRCLHDPQDGYYAARPALGADGDFITAPLVSQMFGELIGLWCVEVWRRLGAPTPFILAEAGPGDGALMVDLLRAARLAPAFLAAARLYLIETSPPLAAAQRTALAAAPLAPVWVCDMESLPFDAPVLLIANELLDCLPARQFVRTPKGWSERVVGVGADGALAFGLAPAPVAPFLPDAAVGAVYEVSAAQEAFGAALGARLAGQGGAALLIDYGRAEPGPGDTLQALKAHQQVDPLAEPGRADLTVHADFPAVATAAQTQGVQASVIITQGLFLTRLGIESRANALTSARPDQSEKLGRQLARLTGDAQMGNLFKVLALYGPVDPIPPGFEMS